jgi:hypothetical protein
VLYNENRRDELKRGADEIETGLSNLDIRKKREERRKRREEYEKEPKNLLFMDENMWNDMSSSDEGHITEEDEGPATLMSPKRIKKEQI